MTWLCPQAFPAGLPFGFCGGYVGWIGYECTADCGFANTHTVSTDDAKLLFADRLVVVDHDCDDVTLVTLVGAGGDAQAQAWRQATRAVVERVQKNAPVPIEPDARRRESFGAGPLRTKEQYLRDIVRCQEVRCVRGRDSYQICLSNQFVVESEIAPFEAYRRLRRGQIRRAVRGVFGFRANVGGLYPARNVFCALSAQRHRRSQTDHKESSPRHGNPGARRGAAQARSRAT